MQRLGTPPFTNQQATMRRKSSDSPTR